MSKIVVKRINKFDVRKEAYLVSRPYANLSDVSQENMEKLEKMDFQLNTLRVDALEFQASAFFRELLTTIRPYFMWAQSSRVNPLEDTKFPSYFTSLELARLTRMKKEIVKEMSEASSAAAQDIVRLGLPLAHMTEFVFATDFRTWISWLLSLRDLMPEYYKLYGPAILDALEVDNIDKYKYKPAILSNFGNTDLDLDYGTYTHGGFTIVKASIPITTRTQLIRHTGLKIRDSHFWVPNTGTSGEFHQLRDKIDVVISVEADMWEKVIKHRTCWIAQYELYDDFIDSYMRTTKERFSEMIPCKGLYQECSCSTDVEARLKGDDPGLPCPIHPSFEFNQSMRLIEERVKLLGVSETSAKFMSLFP